MAPGAAFIAAQVPTTLPPLSSDSGESSRTHVRWAAGGHVSPTTHRRKVALTEILFLLKKKRGNGKSPNNNNSSSLYPGQPMQK